MLVQALDVIRIYDGCIRPPGPKMVVCVEPHLGFFFRINSRAHYQQSLLLRMADHPFLKRDSYLECGCPLELDDYVVSESLIEQGGTIGRLSNTLVPRIIEIVNKEPLLSDADKQRIISALPATQ